MTGTQYTSFDAVRVLEQIRSYWLAQTIHDLSTPIVVARGYVRMVVDDANATANRRFLRGALENLDRLAVLARELRDYPEPDGFDLVPLDVCDLIHRSIGSVRAAESARQVWLTENVPDGCWPTIGDSKKLQLAMEEFVSSAFRFKRSGRAEIEIRRAKDRVLGSLTRALDRDMPMELPDLSVPRRLLRLHGGTASGAFSSDCYQATFELPLVPGSEF